MTATNRDWDHSVKCLHSVSILKVVRDTDKDVAIISEVGNPADGLKDAFLKVSIPLAAFTKVGVPIVDGQLWNAFHNCPYGMCIVMEG